MRTHETTFAALSLAPAEKGRAKVGGRKAGTPNKATRAAREFLAELINRTDVQDAIRQRILKGDTAAFFRAVEHVIGKPRQAVELAQNGPAKVVFGWRDELTARLEEGRKRVAQARGETEDP